MEIWCRASLCVSLMVQLGCAQESADDGPDGRVMEGPDARPADARTDGGGDGGLLGRLDASLRDAPADIARDCEKASEFVAAHRTCSTDADCVIVGSCSGGFGFLAVQVSAQAEAQRLSDTTRCRVYDGPLYNAVCEQGSCRTRPTGAWCGGVRLADGGYAGCPQGQEQYQTTCAAPSEVAGQPSCERRCSGSADSSCGMGRVCTSVRVYEATEPFGQGCGAAFEQWLCRPAAP